MSRMVAKRQCEVGGLGLSFLTQLLANHPPILGWMIEFELFETDEGQFKVRIQAVNHKGTKGGGCEFALESVPTIWKHMKATGAFQRFYDEAQRECEDYLTKIRKAFLIEEPPSIVAKLQEILYMVHDGEKMVKDADKEWGSDTLEEIRRLMRENDLEPKESDEELHRPV